MAVIGAHTDAIAHREAERITIVSRFQISQVTRDGYHAHPDGTRALQEVNLNGLRRDIEGSSYVGSLKLVAGIGADEHATPLGFLSFKIPAEISIRTRLDGPGRKQVDIDISYSDVHLATVRVQEANVVIIGDVEAKSTIFVLINDISPVHYGFNSTGFVDFVMRDTSKPLKAFEF